MRLIAIALAALLAAPQLAALELTASDRVGVDSLLTVRLSEAVNPRAFVSIVDPATDEGEYDGYEYADSTALKVRTPKRAGVYEIRLLGHDRPHATLATRPIEIFMPEASLEAPASAGITENIPITWRGPANDGVYVTLVPADTEDGEYQTFVYLRDAETGRVRLNAPSRPGDYELRYQTHKGVVLTRQPLRVDDVPASLDFPAAVGMGGKLTVRWTGPTNPKNFVAIAKPEAAPNRYEDFRYAQEPSVAIVVPEVPGDYEVRLVSADTQRILAQGALSVGGVQATVESAASVEAGSDFSVTWQGPNNAGDYIAVSHKDDPSKYLTFTYTSRGSPLKVRAPDAPGEYGLHYLTARQGVALGSQALTVVPASGIGTLKVAAANAGAIGSSGASAHGGDAVDGDAAGGGATQAQAQTIGLILDASGSMLQKLGDSRRIDLAKDALGRLIEQQIAPGTPVALRVFGHRNPNGCETELLAPKAPLVRAELSAVVTKINAVNLAKTPIAASLAAIGDDLAGSEGRALIVLVTDGEETCGGDPQAEIAKLKAAGFDFVLNIVGFAIDEPALTQDFQRWAALGGGRYFGAADGSALAQMLVQASSRGPAGFVVMQGQTQVASGEVGGAAVVLKAGTYEVVAGDWRREVIIKANTEASLQID